LFMVSEIAVMEVTHNVADGKGVAVSGGICFTSVPP
jgi:hypothetical protein